MIAALLVAGCTTTRDIEQFDPIPLADIGSQDLQPVVVPSLEELLAAANEALEPAAGSAAPHAFTVTTNDTSGPTITHSPIADGQAANQAVEVLATITDPSGVLSATLFYRESGGSWGNAAMADIGMPDAIAFAMTRMSGSTPLDV